jgi:hypothetical protein
MTTRTAVEELVGTMRHHTRFQISASCRFWWPEPSGELSFASGQTRNLSSGGVCVSAPVLPVLGTVIMLEIDLPRLGDHHGESLSHPLLVAEGTVLRHHDKEGEFVARITHATIDNTPIVNESQLQRII